jgi:hypothetical protein
MNMAASTKGLNSVRYGGFPANGENVRESEVQDVHSAACHRWTALGAYDWLPRQTSCGPTA